MCRRRTGGHRPVACFCLGAAGDGPGLAVGVPVRGRSGRAVRLPPHPLGRTSHRRWGYRRSRHLRYPFRGVAPRGGQRRLQTDGAGGKPLSDFPRARQGDQCQGPARGAAPGPVRHPRRDTQSLHSPSPRRGRVEVRDRTRTRPCLPLLPDHHPLSAGARAVCRCPVARHRSALCRLRLDDHGAGGEPGGDTMARLPHHRGTRPADRVSLRCLRCLGGGVPPCHDGHHQDGARGRGASEAFVPRDGGKAGRRRHSHGPASGGL